MGRVKGEQRGSLHKEKTGWYGRWRQWVADDNGNLEWKSTKKRLCDPTETKARAIEILNSHVSQANGPAACPAGSATVQQFVDARFLGDHVASLKQSGKDHYEYCLKHILPSIGPFRLRDMQPHIVQTFLNAKAKTGLSKQTVIHLRNALSAIFRHAKACGFWRGDLPTELIRIPKAPEPTHPIALTEAQARSLLSNLQEPYRTLVHLIASTGLRIGEALGLDWEHVNLELHPRLVGGQWLAGRTIAVRRHWTRGEMIALKTRNSVRDIPIPADVAAALERLCDPGPNGWLVFANRRGQPLDAHNICNRHLKTACKAAGVPAVGWHALRHTAITLMQQVGMDRAEAQLIAGHSKEGTTARYTHGFLERAREAMDGMRLVTEVVQ